MACLDTKEGGKRRERKSERVRERGKMSGEEGKEEVKAKGKRRRRIPDGDLVCSRCAVTPSQVRVFGASGDAGAHRDAPPPPRAQTKSTMFGRVLVCKCVTIYCGYIQTVPDIIYAHMTTEACYNLGGTRFDHNMFPSLKIATTCFQLHTCGF